MGHHKHACRRVQHASTARAYCNPAVLTCGTRLLCAPAVSMCACIIQAQSHANQECTHPHTASCDNCWRPCKGEMCQVEIRISGSAEYVRCSWGGCACAVDGGSGSGHQSGAVCGSEGTIPAVTQGIASPSAVACSCAAQRARRRTLAQLLRNWRSCLACSLSRLALQHRP
jgi:hypothetical protein